jgi:two-component system sensor histidine kinase TctE
VTRSTRITTGLQRRLVVLLLLPLLILAFVNAWFDYRSAGNAAVQQDRQLAALLPLLVDSVVGPGETATDPPVMLLAPPLDEFLKQGRGLTVFAIGDASGRIVIGEPWLSGVDPNTDQPEFHSEEYNGVIYRIATQRITTPAGELIMVLADGSGSRQQWLQSVLFRVLLPNIVLIVAAALAVSWAVRRALGPLLTLKEDVEHRSPRDLTALDVQATPDEVRPLVESLNRLFGLVNAQADSQRRFVADAAHQLRTPLAGLQAQVEAWAQAAGTGPLDLGNEEILKLRDATRRTSQLAHQLLALSRADARATDAQPRRMVDLKPLCEDILQTFLDSAAAKHIDLGLDVVPVQVPGQEWLLRELLANLVGNAVKYTQEGGSVTIRCGSEPAPEGSEAIPTNFLEVEDDGPGIPQAERGRVLERFYRSPGAEGEGNGLGLAIADEIAHSHRSHLQLLTGQRGGGLRVRLDFPAQVSGLLPVV